MSKEKKATLVQISAENQTKEAPAVDLIEEKAPEQINRETAISILDRTLGGG